MFSFLSNPYVRHFAKFGKFLGYVTLGCLAIAGFIGVLQLFIVYAPFWVKATVLSGIVGGAFLFFAYCFWRGVINPEFP